MSLDTGDGGWPSRLLLGCGPVGIRGERDPLPKSLFLWAYERSTGRYRAVQQSVGEPDPFCLRHREPLGEHRTRDRDRFREIAETELLGLHEGNYPATR